MTIQNEELNAGITLSLNVEVGRGLLNKGQPVIVNDDYTITDDLASGFLPLVYGYVIVPNNEDGGRATVFFRARAVKTLTSFDAFSAGELLAYKDSNTKVSQVSMERASGSITVVDFTWDGGETITVDDVVLTEGTDFSAGTSNEVTARSIATEINLRVPSVRATVDGAIVNLKAMDVGEDNISLATDDDGADVTVSGASLTGSDVSALFSYGIALQEATGADEEVDVLVF